MAMRSAKWTVVVIFLVHWSCLESNPQPSPITPANIVDTGGYWQQGEDVTGAGIDDPLHGGVDANQAAHDAGSLDGIVGSMDGWSPPEGDVTDALAELTQTDGVDETDVGPPEEWRSILYPEDWVPGMVTPEGLSVQDFSHAGYHNSEVPLPETATDEAILVTDQGADNTGIEDSTAAIQAAIDQVSAAGGTVYFPPGLYRCDGLLEVKSSNVVLLGAGPEESRVYFTQHENITGKSHLTFRGTVAQGAEFALLEDGGPGALELIVQGAADLQIGDDVAVGWVITEDFVDKHGMTGTWQAFNGQWHPFFRRKVVAVGIDGNQGIVTLDLPLRYAALVNDAASIRVESGYLSETGIEGLGLANAVAWEAAWTNERAHVLQFSGVKDGWIRNVASFVSPNAPAEGFGSGAHLQNGGIRLNACKRITVADTTMERAQNRGEGGCGYLFELRISSEVLFRDCTGRAGRHNFIQNWGFGVTGCVWLRCLSEEGLAAPSPDLPDIGSIGYSEFHHSLATANLIDSCILHDGWKAVNRKDWSSGAGHTATENVFWNNKGTGELFSRQFAMGYVIGTSGGLTTYTSMSGGWSGEAEGTEPEDYTEGLGAGAGLLPQSLFDDQLARRIGQ
jgi:hypothetical protein